jgi:SAM-dependent methyltransferase
MTQHLELADDSALDSTPAFTCELCNTSQQFPTDADTLFRCGHCGQQYHTGDGSDAATILLTERQLQALRTLAGRDASGQSTLVTNWWTANNQPVGEDFLTWNKTSPAREHCRQLIRFWALGGAIRSVLEVAFGGLHEFRCLREDLTAAGVTWSGVDWTAHFVAHARREFPNNRWTQGDIVRGVSVEGADLVYSQHMLEHVPALEPAFSNMLRLAGRRLINIFFIPPKPFDGYEVVNWKQYPLYHNTYSVGHVEAVCKAMGFRHQWLPFGPETVLVAERI